VPIFWTDEKLAEKDLAYEAFKKANPHRLNCCMRTSGLERMQAREEAIGMFGNKFCHPRITFYGGHPNPWPLFYGRTPPRFYETGSYYDPDAVHRTARNAAAAERVHRRNLRHLRRARTPEELEDYRRRSGAVLLPVRRFP
jgi:hypothetical protein